MKITNTNALHTNTALKLISLLLACIYLASGGAKLLSLSFEIEAFTRWEYPLWFMYFIGAAEVAGGIALLSGFLRKIAAPLLCALMIGAVITHIRFQEWPMFVVALSILILSALLSVKLWKQ